MQISPKISIQLKPNANDSSTNEFRILFLFLPNFLQILNIDKKLEKNSDEDADERRQIIPLTNSVFNIQMNINFKRKK